MSKIVSHTSSSCTSSVHDLRIQKTLESIQMAFYELVSEKNYDRLTVSDLCKRARIARKTFYIHYNSIHDLMESILYKMGNEYRMRINGLSAPKDFYEIIYQFYLYSDEQGAFYENLLFNKSYELSGEVLLKSFIPIAWDSSPLALSLDTDKRELLYCFLYSSGSALYKQWVRNGKRTSIKEMVEYTNAFLLRGIMGMGN